MKNAKRILQGSTSQVSSSKEKEILNIVPLLLEEVEGVGQIGKGKFWTVFLKRFKSSPVAVKYFHASASAKLIEKKSFIFK